MQAKPLLLAAALLAFPATTALAQSSPSSSAPMQSSSSASSASQDTTAPQSQTAAPASPAMPATAADVKVAAPVFDTKGAQIGTIESVTSAGAVIATGTARAQIPVASFAKNDQGLMINMTKSQFLAAITSAAPAKP